MSARSWTTGLLAAALATAALTEDEAGSGRRAAPPSKPSWEFGLTAYPTMVRNGDTVIVKRSLIDGILQHTSAAIQELAGINADLVGDMHRRMVDRASSQEEACSDLAKKMIQFGEDYIQSED
jgi:hypothetical protein